MEALGHFEAVGAERLRAQRQRALQQTIGRLVEREVAVDLADGIEEGRLRFGIAGKLGLDALRAAVENLAGGDRLPLRVRRIRLAEQAGDEPRHAFDPRGLGSGAIPFDGRDRLLLPGAPRLDHRRDEADRERGDDQRTGDDRRAMPRRELPGAIRPAVGPGRDRQPVEMARDVLLKEVDRGVAARGILVQRLHHDRVQIAGQPALQPIGPRAPDTGDLLGVGRDVVRHESDARPDAAASAATALLGEGVSPSQMARSTSAGVFDVKRCAWTPVRS